MHRRSGRNSSKDQSNIMQVDTFPVLGSLIEKREHSRRIGERSRQGVSHTSSRRRVLSRKIRTFIGKEVRTGDSHVCDLGTISADPHYPQLIIASWLRKRPTDQA